MRTMPTCPPPRSSTLRHAVDVLSDITESLVMAHKSKSPASHKEEPAPDPMCRRALSIPDILRFAAGSAVL